MLSALFPAHKALTMKLVNSTLTIALLLASQSLLAQSCPTGTVAGRVNSVDGVLSVCAALNGVSDRLINAPTDLATVQVEFSADTAALPPGLARHALNAFGTRTVVGGTFFGAVGTDFSPNGSTLFVLTRVNANVPAAVNGIGTINTATGAPGTITPLTGLGAENPLGMAIDPVSGEILITTREAGVATRLRSVNPTTGATTLIGQIGTTFSSIDIAINCTGQVFAITPAAAAPGSVLSTLNRTTAAPTTVGNYQQLGVGFFQSIDFDNQDGSLYGWLTTGDTTTTTFAYGSFNTTTAAFTAAATTPVGQVFGAIPTTCPAALPVAVTPSGTALAFQVGAGGSATRTLSFTGTGSVACTATGPFTVSPNPLVAPGSVTVTATGAGTGTLTCVSGPTTIATYPLSATALVAAPGLNMWGAFGLLLALSVFGAAAVRRYS
jgi:hypothetical protein